MASRNNNVFSPQSSVSFKAKTGGDMKKENQISDREFFQKAMKDEIQKGSMTVILAILCILLFIMGSWYLGYTRGVKKASLQKLRKTLLTKEFFTLFDNGMPLETALDKIPMSSNVTTSLCFEKAFKNENKSKTSTLTVSDILNSKIELSFVEGVLVKKVFKQNILTETEKNSFKKNGKSFTSKRNKKTIIRNSSFHYD